MGWIRSSVTVIPFLYGLDMIFVIYVQQCDSVLTGMFLAGAVIGGEACWYVEIVAQGGACTRRGSTPGLSRVVGGGY